MSSKFSNVSSQEFVFSHNNGQKILRKLPNIAILM